MLVITPTEKFKKDYKLCKKRGYNMDLLLVYCVEGDRLMLYRTGTHADLFGK
ncbi:MAG: type II toxin-antitoxin system YafQ family toxin [Butyrivibrio sp.]|nr:type II toxin-antitoxin system YafQ family toxin [Butyrivibrio sp.]